MEHTLDDSLIKGAVPDIIYTRFSAGKEERLSASVPGEMALTIYIDSEELVTLLCTPVKLPQLVLGFLYSEGVIAGKDGVAGMRVCEEESLADVRLVEPGYKPPERRTISSGCGGGITFSPERQRVESDLVVSPGVVLSLMKQLNERAELHRLCGGVHTSALGDTNDLNVVAEDIGRHNTLDKIMGECLMLEMPTTDGILLTTGRISSEMLSKAARMETPVVVSRSSPTDKSISLARELGITLIGYVRGNRISVYTHEERVKGAPAKDM